MRLISKFTLITLVLTNSLVFHGCDIIFNKPTTQETVKPATKNKAPVISAFDFSPKTEVPESRVFVDRFNLKNITDVKRITVELLKAPMWSSTEYAGWFIDGITLVGEWQI